MKFFNKKFLIKSKQENTESSAADHLSLSQNNCKGQNQVTTVSSTVSLVEKKFLKIMSQN